MAASLLSPLSMYDDDPSCPYPMDSTYATTCWCGHTSPSHHQHQRHTDTHTWDVITALQHAQTRARDDATRVERVRHVMERGVQDAVRTWHQAHDNAIKHTKTLQLQHQHHITVQHHHHITYSSTSTSPHISSSCSSSSSAQSSASISPSRSPSTSTLLDSFTDPSPSPSHQSTSTSTSTSHITSSHANATSLMSPSLQHYVTHVDMMETIHETSSSSSSSDESSDESSTTITPSHDTPSLHDATIALDAIATFAAPLLLILHDPTTSPTPSTRSITPIPTEGTTQSQSQSEHPSTLVTLPSGTITAASTFTSTSPSDPSTPAAAATSVSLPLVQRSLLLLQAKLTSADDTIASMTREMKKNEKIRQRQQQRWTKIKQKMCEMEKTHNATLALNASLNEQLTQHRSRIASYQSTIASLQRAAAQDECSHDINITSIVSWVQLLLSGVLMLTTSWKRIVMWLAQKILGTKAVKITPRQLQAAHAMARTSRALRVT